MNPIKMTRIFLEEFLSSGSGRKCARCSAPTEKSMCPKHLKSARIAFRVWTVERVAKKLCIKCPGHGLQVRAPTGEKRQGVYCRLHKEVNRKRCLHWAREHRVEIRAEYKRRVTLRVCVQNPAHGKAYGKHINCRRCHLRRHMNRQLQRVR